jgi:hypothetical protein
MFPQFTKGKGIQITGWYLQMKPKQTNFQMTVVNTAKGISNGSNPVTLTGETGVNVPGPSGGIAVAVYPGGTLLKLDLRKGTGTPVPVQITDDLDDLFLVATYKLGPAITGTDPGMTPPPPAPPAGMLAWWKAEQGIAQVNGAVDVWGDASGNGYDLQAWAASTRPVLTTYNSKPVLSFTNSLLVQNSGLPQGASFTIFFVGNTNFGQGFDNYGTGWSISLDYSEARIVQVQNGPAMYTLTQPLQSTPIRLSAATLKQNTLNSEFSLFNKDGQLQESKIISNTKLRQSSLGFHIGSQGLTYSYVNGFAHEIIVYNRVLNATERNTALTYLKTKYNL